MIYKLILLLAGHALCDYPLQGDFLATGKNRFRPINGVPWYQCMAAHCLIHAGMVFLITKSPVFAGLEFVIHFLTDYAKCAGWFGGNTFVDGVIASKIHPKSFNIDQAIHYACKLLWAVL